MSAGKPFHPQKYNENGECTNHLQQDFNQKALHLVWASDFTYIKTPGNGTISALSLIFIPSKSSPGISQESQMLIWSRLSSKKPTKKETHHSISCFILTEKRNILHLHFIHVVQSFSKKGYLFDNSCCKFFFKYLKKEEINRKTSHSLQKLQLSVFGYIEGFHNAIRPHGALGMMTPNEKG